MYNGSRIFRFLFYCITQRENYFLPGTNVMTTPCVGIRYNSKNTGTVYPKKYAHGFVVLCFVVVMQSFIMNSHEVFIHIHQGCFAGTGAIVRLPQCQWSKPDGYGIISQCITTTKHSKAKIVCIFLGIYCSKEGPWHSSSQTTNNSWYNRQWVKSMTSVMLFTTVLTLKNKLFIS